MTAEFDFDTTPSLTLEPELEPAPQLAVVEEAASVLRRAYYRRGLRPPFFMRKSVDI